MEYWILQKDKTEFLLMSDFGIWEEDAGLPTKVEKLMTTLNSEIVLISRWILFTSFEVY